MRPEYDDLVVRIGIGGSPSHPYPVLIEAGQERAPGAFSVPIGDTELERFVDKVGDGSDQMKAAKELGRQLFEAVFRDTVRDVYSRARQRADHYDNRGLRVTFCLGTTPELMKLPWEYLHDGQNFLSQSIYTPVVRSLDLSAVASRPGVRLPLRILGMVGSHSGLDVQQEKQKLRAALRALDRKGLVKIQWLKARTLVALERELAKAVPVHVFHYVGHGVFDPDRKDGELLLEDREGEPSAVSGDRLGALFRDKRTIRLAVLNSCEGARTSYGDPFSGVATSLIGHGIPAVIGMQFEITDEAALAFSERLYSSLAQRLPVDAAVAQARKSISAAGTDVEFGTPVLFLQGTDARLFPEEDAEPLSLGGTTDRAVTAGKPSTIAKDELARSTGTKATDGAPTALRWSPDPRYLFEHNNVVSRVAFSPDGRYLATGSFDRFARLWRLQDGKEYRRFTHDKKVDDVAFSPDGQLLATASGTQIKLWDIEGRQGQSSFKNPWSLVAARIAFSPDGRYLASAVADKQLRVWDVETRQLVDRVKHYMAPHDVTFSPDGRYIFTCGDKFAIGWEMGSPQVFTSHFRHPGMVFAIEVSPDGRFVATASADKKARLWDIAKGREKAIFVHDGPVQEVAFSPDGRFLATASADRRARVWDIAARKEHVSYVHNGSVRDVALSPDGRFLATCSEDPIARLWESA